MNDLTNPMASKAEILTYTGKWFNVFDPNRDNIDIEDIAHALSHQCRWSGHVKTFYSVAQHSLFVCNLLPEKYKLAGLLHDSSEAFLVDIPRPVKLHFSKYKAVEDNLMKIIAKKFKFDYPLHEIVKKADDDALMHEWDNYILCEKAEQDSSIPNFSFVKAEFLKEFERLTRTRK